MAVTTIMLVDSSKLGEFYFSKDPVELARQFLKEGLYTTALSTVFVNLKGPVYKTGEEAAEECFDLTNNPSRMAERAAKYGYNRSLSVGDIVETSTGRFLCMSTGWAKIAD
jgi:hypothetical protein